MVAVSCSKSNDETEQSNTIIGKWEVQSIVEKTYNYYTKELLKTENIAFPKNIKYSTEFKSSGKGDFFGEVKRYNHFDFSYTDKTVDIKLVNPIYGDVEDDDDEVMVRGGNYTIVDNTLQIIQEYDYLEVESPKNPKVSKHIEYIQTYKRIK